MRQVLLYYIRGDVDIGTVTKKYNGTAHVQF